MVKFRMAILLLICVAQLKAQFTYYSFSQFSGGYTAITSGTSLGTVNSDDEVFVNPAFPLGQGVGTSGPGFPIGFNFFINGNLYNRVGVNCNGFIMFGNSASNPAIISQIANAFAPISSAAGGNFNQQLKVVAFGRDIEAQGAGSEIRIETIGTSPNQTFVVQWSNYRKYNNPTGDNFNFQIRLCETTNNIEVIYGSFVNNTTAAQAQVGLRGGIPQDFNNRFVNALNVWSISAAGTTNTAVVNVNSSLVPASGLVYRWTPPPPCTGTPATNTTQASAITICPGGSATLSLLNSYSLTGITYNWMASTTSSIGPFTTIVGAGNSFHVANGIGTNTWYQCAISCANGGGAVISSPVQVLTTGAVLNTVPYTESFENLLVNNQLPNCSWAASNPTTICQTNIASAPFNRVPRTGNKFATFRRGTNTAGDYFYTNGMQLNAGVTYSASVWYISDGLNGWTAFGMYRCSAQNTLALTPIATVTAPAPGNITNIAYTALSNTFTVPSNGIYYIAIRCVGSATPEYFSFDDLEVTAPCSLNAPQITVTANPTLVCAGSGVTLTASGASSYTWQSGPTGPTYSFVPGTSGFYTVIGTNSLTNCSASQTQSVGVELSPFVSIYASTYSVCEGASLTLTGLGANSYTWSTGSNQTNVSVSPLVATNYSLTGSYANGCAATASVQIAVAPLPTVQASASATRICQQEAVTLTATGALTYLWKSTGSINNSPVYIVSPAASTTYTVTGTNQQGCESNAQVGVTVDACLDLAAIKTGAATTLKLYPVPCKNKLTVELPGIDCKSACLFNANGGLVKQIEIPSKLFNWDVSDLPSGIYLLVTDNNLHARLLIENE